MKRKYIIFYATENGNGSTDMKVSRKEKPSSISNIRKIEETLSKELGYQVSLTNFKFVGYTWK